MICWTSVQIQAAPDHRISNSVVQILGRDQGGRLYFGSGVVISNAQVATNCHVVRSGGNLEVHRGYRTYPVTGERVDMEGDLCLLEVPGLDIRSARIGSTASLKRGDSLHFYGFPRALGLSYTDGRLIRISQRSGVPLMETSVFFTLGGSGGGLFDGKGRLVGFATFISKGHSGGYFAVGVDRLSRVRNKPLKPIEMLQGPVFWEQSVSDAKGPNANASPRAGHR